MMWFWLAPLGLTSGCALHFSIGAKLWESRQNHRLGKFRKGPYARRTEKAMSILGETFKFLGLALPESKHPIAQLSLAPSKDVAWCVIFAGVQAWLARICMLGNLLLCAL